MISCATPRVWDAAPRKAIAALTYHAGLFSSAAFSPDGGRIVTVSGKAIVWDAATGKTIATLEDQEGWIKTAAFSPDGRRIVTVSQRNLGRPPPLSTPLAPALPPTGRILPPLYDTTARVWDASTGSVLVTLANQ
jgi:WD40 repeat protein